MNKIKNIYSQKYKKPYLCMSEEYRDKWIATSTRIEIMESGIDKDNEQEHEYVIIKVYLNEKENNE